MGTWRGLVAAGALDVLEDADGWTAAVAVRLRFRSTRPASHYGAHGVLPRFAARYPGPDLDKLARAVLDALSGIAYRDDRQVVALVASKRYGSPPGVDVIVREVRATYPNLWRTEP